MLQYVAVCCSILVALQCDFSTNSTKLGSIRAIVLKSILCVAVCCSVFAVYCSALQCDFSTNSTKLRVIRAIILKSTLCVAVCCSVLQCVVVRCSATFLQMARRWEVLVRLS